MTSPKKWTPTSTNQTRKIDSQKMRWPVRMRIQRRTNNNTFPGILKQKRVQIPSSRPPRASNSTHRASRIYLRWNLRTSLIWCKQLEISVKIWNQMKNHIFYKWNCQWVVHYFIYLLRIASEAEISYLSGYGDIFKRKS